MGHIEERPQPDLLPSSGLNETFQPIISFRVNTQKRESDEGFQKHLGSHAVSLTSGHFFHLISSYCMKMSTVDFHRWILLFFVNLSEMMSRPQATYCSEKPWKH